MDWIAEARVEVAFIEAYVANFTDKKVATRNLNGMIQIIFLIKECIHSEYTPPQASGDNLISVK